MSILVPPTSVGLIVVVLQTGHGQVSPSDLQFSTQLYEHSLPRLDQSLNGESFVKSGMGPKIEIDNYKCVSGEL